MASRRVSSSRDSQSENPSNESPSDPKMEASSLSGSNVERLRKQYHIPEQYELFAPGTDGWINSPPLSQVAFYVKDLRACIRFLILEFVWNLFDYYGLCPAQLAPNSIWLIINFVLLCRLIPMSLILLSFKLFLFFIFILRSRIGGSSTQEKVFLSSSIFHRSFMDEIINFSLFLLLLPKAFVHVGVIRGLASTRIVRWRSMIEKISTD